MDLNKSAGIARPSSVPNGKASVPNPVPQRAPQPPVVQRAVQPVQQQPAASPGYAVHLNMGENAHLASINGQGYGAAMMPPEEIGRLDRLEEAVAILAQGDPEDYAQAPTNAAAADKVRQPALSRDSALKQAVAETKWRRQQYDSTLRIQRLNEANRKHYAVADQPSVPTNIRPDHELPRQAQPDRRVSTRTAADAAWQRAQVEEHYRARASVDMQRVRSVQEINRRHYAAQK